MVRDLPLALPAGRQRGFPGGRRPLPAGLCPDPGGYPGLYLPVPRGGVVGGLQALVGHPGDRRACHHPLPCGTVNTDPPLERSVPYDLYLDHHPRPRPGPEPGLLPRPVGSAHPGTVRSPGHEIAMLGPEEGTRLELIGGGEIPEHPAPTLSLGFAPENMGQPLAALEARAIPTRPMSPTPPYSFTSWRTLTATPCSWWST